MQHLKQLKLVQLNKKKKKQTKTSNKIKITSKQIQYFLYYTTLSYRRRK